MKRLLSSLSGLLVMASLVLTGCPQEVPPVIEYDVTFDLGYEGATGAPETQTVESGETATAPAVPTRDNFSFDGWYLGDAAYDFSTAVTASITLVAHWTIVQATVSFDLGYDGATGAPASQTLDVGTVATAPTAPTREHYSFDGWYLGNAAYDFTTAVSASITLVAQWTIDQHTITFDVNGASGTVPVAQTVDYGTALTLPGVGDMTFGSKTFVGWATSDSATTALSFYNVEADDTLYAVWSDAPVYVITFDLNYTGAPVATTSSVIEGNAVSEPVAPTRSGYTFDAWYEDAAGTTEYVFTTPVTAADTLYAKWTLNTYSVSFDLNYTGASGAPDTQTISHGSVATEPAIAPVRSGYIFEGWYEDSAGTTEYDFEILVTAVDTLYAKWTALLPKNGLMLDTPYTGDVLAVVDGTQVVYQYLNTVDTLALAEGGTLNFDFVVYGLSNYKQIALQGEWNSYGWSSNAKWVSAGIADGTVVRISQPVSNADALTGFGFKIIIDNPVTGAVVDTRYELRDFTISYEAPGAIPSIPTTAIVVFDGADNSLSNVTLPGYQYAVSLVETSGTHVLDFVFGSNSYASMEFALPSATDVSGKSLYVVLKGDAGTETDQVKYILYSDDTHQSEHNGIYPTDDSTFVADSVSGFWKAYNIENVVDATAVTKIIINFQKATYNFQIASIYFN